ncbi:MAG: hypothetical protein Q7R41_14285 [Phycisphaerales bacterium]|nr:hypothetical protein [Phycisphaerales bacterium]
MKHRIRMGKWALTGMAWAGTVVLAAPLGTAITYQGQLKVNGVPLDSTVAMTFQLFDAPTAGLSTSSLLSFPAVSVVNGLFTVDLDFGAAPFASDARYLQVRVNNIALSPRQRIGPTPFALRTLSAPNGHSLDAADGSPTDALFVNNSGFVGIGTTSPGVPIDAVGSSQTMLSLSSSHAGGTWLNIGNTSPGGKGWNLITTGSGNGEGAGHLLFRNGSDSSVVMLLTYDGKMYLRSELVVDQGNTNTGTVAGGLRFGFNSGEAIASKRSTGGNQYGLDFYTSSLPRVSIAGNGNVGIGTTNPAAPLDVAVGDKRFQVRSDGGLVPGINLTGTGGNLGILRIRNAIEMWPDDGRTRPGKIALVNAAATAFTIALDGDKGNASFAGNLSFGSATRQMLDLWGGVYGIGVQGYTEYFRSDGGFAWFNKGSHNDATNNPGAGGSVLMVLDSSGNLGIGTTSPAAKLDVNGRTRTKSLEIVGGADLAEPFEVRVVDDPIRAATVRERAGSEATDGRRDEGMKVEPGMVVVIDSDHPGALRVSAQPYDRKVAGVISGANGLATGMIMRAEGDAAADGRYPLALSGRVWCRCDASQGAITPGDLLTTSATPGHAMRVADDKDAPRGCIIGKAMTPLSEGKGLVLVLVNLQ